MLALPSKIAKFSTVCFVGALLTGCASPKDPQDPFQGYNRAMFKFNRGVDKVVLRPAAKVYDTITPKFVQARVTNFYENINLIPTVANDILQFQGYRMFADTSRFIVNSTVGIGGLFDPAKKIDLPYHSNDLGITLAKYGMRNSPYFMIPIIGPSTIRDGIGMVGNTYMSPYPYIDPAISYSLFGLYIVKKRADFLPTDKIVDDAFDPYVLVRNAYLQKRNHDIDVALGKADGSDTFVAEDGTTTTADTANTSSNATMTSNSSKTSATENADAEKKISQTDKTLTADGNKKKLANDNKANDASTTKVNLPTPLADNSN